jgi:formylglycine-generating enzyme required for sulfatase activity
MRRLGLAVILGLLITHSAIDAGPTVDKPVTRPPTPPESSPTKLALAAPIKKLVTPEQVDLGGPIVNSIDIVLVPIPAGEFTMGSPESEPDRQGGETQHLVKITKPFYLSAHEVTQQQYESVMQVSPWEGKDYAKKGPGYPATHVNWDEAVAFCGKLSKQEGVEYRLPTEAEWEYACRAGTTTAYSFGDDVRQLPQHAWYSGSSNGSTHPVGELKPNAWGLFDMHGNVREWCQDWHGRYESLEVSDPTGAASGRHRVLRGGAFFHLPMHVRAAVRLFNLPVNRYHVSGFRLTRTYNLSP